MAAPAETTPSAPMKWYQPVIGLVFALLVVGGLAIAAAASDGAYESGTHGTEHGDETESGDDAEHDDDADHGEDTDHSEDIDDGDHDDEDDGH